jgi:hypothetical protein
LTNLLGSLFSCFCEQEQNYKYLFAYSLKILDSLLIILMKSSSILPLIEIVLLLERVMFGRSAAGGFVRIEEEGHLNHHDVILSETVSSPGKN